jgi:hypothetical protein
MNTQNQIKRTLSESTSKEYVCGLLESKGVAHRTALAGVVCEQFGFYDARGQPQLAGCLKALRELEGAGHFTLPTPRTSPGRKAPRRLPDPVPLPIGVPSEAGMVRGLDLVLVTTSEQMGIWNELMIDEHPQGDGPLVGRQVRYLIGSGHGWLGGFGFAAEALQLADCDKWIGWDREQRREHLHFVVGTNQTGAQSRGLHFHSTFAIAPNGLPLGVVRAQCPAPKGKSPDDDRPRFAIPIEEKKTFAWIEHHRDLVELAGEMPHTRLIDVCDREADFFEMFDEQRRDPRVDLLVCAKYNRNITVEPFKLFAAIRHEPVGSRVRVHIPRQSARPKRSKQKARPKRPGRTADMAVRHMRIQLLPAHYHADKEPLDIGVIHALEENPPPGTQAVEWFLLTTIRITSAKDAEQCLRWYCLRWRIEDWHRVLKSGCRIEDLGYETAERLRRAIAINLVIAWRIMLMTLLGRETPELPAEVLFSDIELRTLGAYVKKNV